MSEIKKDSLQASEIRCAIRDTFTGNYCEELIDGFDATCVRADLAQQATPDAELLFMALEAVLPYCVFDNFTGMYAQKQAVEALAAHRRKG